MMRVLLVDDDINILKSLSRSIRKARKSWTVTVVESVRHAEIELSLNCYDVVVTDMEMPKAGGIELLNTLTRDYPQTARVVLSGAVDQSTTFECVASEHLYLAKPCPTDLVVQTIERAYDLFSPNRSTHAELRQVLNQKENTFRDFLAYLLLRDAISYDDIPAQLQDLLSPQLVKYFSPRQITPLDRDLN